MGRRRKERREPPQALYPEGHERMKPLGHIRCQTCGTVIPIYSVERPIAILCPGCGRKGLIP